MNKYCLMDPFYVTIEKNFITVGRNEGMIIFFLPYFLPCLRFPTICNDYIPICKLELVLRPKLT